MGKQHKSLAFVFPGQGSQYIGMLKECAHAYSLIIDTFEEASYVAGFDLWALAQHGPVEALNDTCNTQPVLLTAGVALWRLWILQGGILPAYLVGHSLGEVTALVCADALSFADGVKLVIQRAKFMQEAVPHGQGAMAAIIGVDDMTLQAVCKEAAHNEIVAPANLNAPSQTVISGDKNAVERACALAKSKGAKKIIPLSVSVPSHCALMKPAAQKLEKQLENVKITSPKIAVLHNVDVGRCQHPDDIRDRLVKQLYHPVRWVEIIQRLRQEHIHTFVECGPSKILTGLIKRIDPACKPMSIETPQELNMALEQLE